MQKEYYLAIKRIKFYDLPQQMIGMGDRVLTKLILIQKNNQKLTHIRKIWKRTEIREVQGRALVAGCWRNWVMGRWK